jgi:hypothetical protein
MVSVTQTPQPPYFAVIFTSVRTDGDNDYGETAKQMLEPASEQPGFLGFVLVPKLRIGNPDGEALASQVRKLELSTPNSQARPWELAQKRKSK